MCRRPRLLRGSRNIEHVVGWNKAGAGLRTAASLSGLMLVVVTVAGQRRYFTTQAKLCDYVAEIREAQRDEQVASVQFSWDATMDVWDSMTTCGGMTPMLVDRLPARDLTEVTLRGLTREAQRHTATLSNGHGRASEVRRVAERAVPEAVGAWTLLDQATTAAAMADYLRRVYHAQQGDAAAPVEAVKVAKALEARARAHQRLGTELTVVLDRMHEHPGDGWFAGDERAKVREIVARGRDHMAQTRRASGLLVAHGGAGLLTSRERDGKPLNA